MIIVLTSQQRLFVRLGWKYSYVIVITVMLNVPLSLGSRALLIDESVDNSTKREEDRNTSFACQSSWSTPGRRGLSGSCIACPRRLEAPSTRLLGQTMAWLGTT